MQLQLSKKSILKKTAQVGVLTFLSRMLGIMRELLMVRFLGVGAISDAFMTAFKLPNFFRQIFAEGALSASFVPVMVKTVKEGNRHEANGLMTISFLFFEGIVLLLYAFVMFFPHLVFMVLAPGFSQEQIGYAVPFLRILFSFLFFISSSALLAGALNAVNHFFIPALGTPLWNIIYIASLLLCLAYKLPVTYLCFGVIVGAFVQFLAHVIVFFRYNFTFGPIDTGVKATFKSVLAKFLPCLFGVSIVEFNLFVSTSIASFLPKGSITLLSYGFRFMNIALGMFAVALSSIMLSHFSRVVLYAPRRLHFYLLEAAKFVTWLMLPAALFLMFTSKPIFIFFLGSKATPETVFQGSWILFFYCIGLLFLGMNKILLSMFYALKDTWATTIAASVCAVVNIAGDLISLKFFGVYGIAVSNTISGITMTIMCFTLLRKRHHIHFYGRRYLRFAARFALQLALGAFFFWLTFTHIQQAIRPHWPRLIADGGLGYWTIIFFVACFFMAMIFATSRLFKVKLYFLHK